MRKVAKERVVRTPVKVKPIQPIMALTVSTESTTLVNKSMDKMKKKLQGARFRFLNEELYTKPSHLSFDTFQQNPELFQEYHQGFRVQCAQWPVNPLDLIMASIEKRVKKVKAGSTPVVVADLGCGEARLARTLVPKYEASVKVHSFDLVSTNELKEWVQACNITQTPLKDCSVDVVVLCLALMGTDLSKIIREAHRILKQGGTLYLAEVESRFESVDAFVEALEQSGFHLASKKTELKMFVLMELKKNKPWRDSKSDSPLPKLKPCIYKRR